MPEEVKPLVYKQLMESGFANTYGGLNLVVRSDGEMFLEMQDCIDAAYFGPLTNLELGAFLTLVRVKEFTHE